MSWEEEKKLHIAMYPWLAMGHITPFLHLANKLAERGHKVSFLVPPNPQPKLAHLNLHPDLISFITVAIPPCDGLPLGANTTADVPLVLGYLLFKPFDLTKPTIEAYLSQLKPDLVFYDYAHWLPGLARKHGAKSIFFSTTYICFYAYMAREPRRLEPGTCISEAGLREAPPGFPSRAIYHRAHEASGLAKADHLFVGVSKMSFPEMVYASLAESDAVCTKSCREMEGPFGNYFQEHCRKPVLWAGPIMSDPPGSAKLDHNLQVWLNGFQVATVIYCALGSETVLSKHQFQQLLLGIELTGFPFIIVLKVPMECENIEGALPEGFLERVKGRGIVQDVWVQQNLILKHPSAGCFVTHCGVGSLSEALVGECQLVLLPQFGDQFINARLMSGGLRVGLEVEKGETDGLFYKESICDAVMTVMDRGSRVGKEISDNHAKWREILSSKHLQDAYMNDLINNLRVLVQDT